MRQKRIADGNRAAGLRSDARPKATRRSPGAVSLSERAKASASAAAAAEAAKREGKPSCSISHTPTTGPSASARFPAAPKKPMASPRPPRRGVFPPPPPPPRGGEPQPPPPPTPPPRRRRGGVQAHAGAVDDADGEQRPHAPAPPVEERGGEEEQRAGDEEGEPAVAIGRPAGPRPHRHGREREETDDQADLGFGDSQGPRVEGDGREQQVEREEEWEGAGPEAQELARGEAGGSRHQARRRARARTRAPRAPAARSGSSAWPRPLASRLSQYVSRSRGVRNASSTAGAASSSQLSQWWSIRGKRRSRPPASATRAQPVMPTPASALTPRARTWRTSARVQIPSATAPRKAPNVVTTAAPVGRSQRYETVSPITLTRNPKPQPSSRRPATERVSSPPTTAGTIR